tara:strand:+ start:1018 stop:1569 length:552 start_codon:yes stop_codon:yes gene_type:complete
MEQPENRITTATKAWIEEIIIGLNFCPFAKKEFVNNTIRYHVSEQVKVKNALVELDAQCQLLQNDSSIETSLIIYEQGFKSFERYLDLVDLAQDLIETSGFEGQFQLATMHPDYCFEGEAYDDPANFTNRSPYPMLHLIREESMAKVLSVFKNPEQIPEDNIELAHEKGANFFRSVLERIHAK